MYEPSEKAIWGRPAKEMYAMGALPLEAAPLELAAGVLTDDSSSSSDES